MTHSSLPTAAAPSSAYPLFGGLRPADLSIRLAEANAAVALAWITLDHPALDIKDLDSGRPEVIRMLVAAMSEVSSLIGAVRSAGGDPSLMNDLHASLKQAGDMVNRATALVPALDAKAAGEALRSAQVWLNAVAQDVRWEVELFEAAREFEQAEQNRSAAKAAGRMPVFRPAPDMPRDAGSVSWLAVASLVGIAILMALLVAVFGGPKKADARALDGKPVQAVKVAPTKSSPKPKCSPLYRVDLTVRTTAKSTADGRYHAAVWVQADNRRPVRDEHGVWQYARPLKVGFGVSDSKRVPVSGCLDPRRVDGVDGTPIYLILNDPVDDDRDAQGRIRRGTVLVKFVEGHGWHVVKAAQK